MYRDVVITDNSWLVIMGYEITSLLLMVPLYLISSEKVFTFRFKKSLNLLIVLIAGSCQFGIAKFGAGSLYQFFHYGAWDDSIIRYSAVLFFILYILFLADWKKIFSLEKGSARKDR